MKNKRITLILALLIILISCISIFIGAYDVRISELLNGDSTQAIVMINSRLPRLLALLCTGFGMSVAGLLMQNLTMNKFVSPTTGATISSAQLGIIIGIAIFPTASLGLRTMFAFAFSMIGTWIFVAFIQSIKMKDVIMVPLIGIMFNSVIGGISSHIAFENDLSQILSNLLVGDFSLILSGRYEIVFLILPLVVVAFYYANHFNIVGMGENFSKNLGVNYNFIMFLGLTISALISASVVVTVGTISYIGLIIPNIVSMFKGDKIKNNLIDVALSGALFILICDIIGRVIIRPFELPIALIVGVIGSFVFLILLFYKLSNKKKVGA